MNEPVLLKTNTFWGRRSGVTTKLKDRIEHSFPQQKYGGGSSGAGRPVRTNLVNVNKKWFGRDYKRTK